MTEIQEIKAELEEIKSLLAANDSGMWTVKDIARYFKVKDSKAYEIIHMPWFPKPDDSTVKEKRYFADEVREAHRKNAGRLV